MHHQSTYMSELTTTLQTISNTRPDQEVFAALLLITALAIGSLFVVAKTVGNRLMRSTLKKDQCAGEVVQGLKMKEGRRPNTIVEVEPSAEPWTIDDGHPDRRSNRNSKNSQSNYPSLQQQLPKSQNKRARDLEIELYDIRDWEEFTRNRIQRRKNRMLEELSSFDDPHSTARKRDIYSINVWEESTLSRMEQEKTRRLRRLSSCDWQNVSSEKVVDKTLDAWLQAAKREVARENGSQPVGDWEIE